MKFLYRSSSYTTACIFVQLQVTIQTNGTTSLNTYTSYFISRTSVPHCLAWIHYVLAQNTSYCLENVNGFSVCKLYTADTFTSQLQPGVEQYIKSEDDELYTRRYTFSLIKVYGSLVLQTFYRCCHFKSYMCNILDSERHTE